MGKTKIPEKKALVFCSVLPHWNNFFATDIVHFIRFTAEKQTFQGNYRMARTLPISLLLCASHNWFICHFKRRLLCIKNY